jgi:uncharacterized delta-60 repeat protein/uncharacterized repeat protein (TIGR01451 family)
MRNFLFRPVFFFLLLFSNNILHAQYNPAEPDTSFGMGTLNGAVYSIAVQSDGKIIAGGGIFTRYEKDTVSNIVRLNPDGTLDKTFNVGSGASGLVRKIVIQSDGKILVAGAFSSFNGVLKNRIVRLNSDGSFDNTFSIGTGFNNEVHAMICQADGKILVGGAFSAYNGTTKSQIVRLNNNGSIDNTFNTGTGFNNPVYSLDVQSDGKILAGGYFTSFNGVTTNNLVRLNQDGSLDNSFLIGTGANSNVASIVCQADGKILLGGGFTSFNGTASNFVVRLNSDGTIDSQFNTGYGANNAVISIALQTDGKILVSGLFNTFGNVQAIGVVRLNSDGTIDNSFALQTLGSGTLDYYGVISSQPDGKILVGGNFVMYNKCTANKLLRLNSNGTIDNTFKKGNGANDWIKAIAYLPDGKVLVGGQFVSFNGVIKNGIACLNSDGTISNSFNTGTGANASVYSLILQPDGKIIVGGQFTTFNGVANKRGILRLNSDGSIDNTFNAGTGADDVVLTLALQSDGKILVGGLFTSFNGAAKNRLVRLNSDGSVDNTFAIGSGANNSIETILQQSDGKIIIGGAFTTFNGQAKNYIVRLNVGGSIDNSFNMGTGFNNSVYSIAQQPNDEKILIGGSFSLYNALPSNGIVRLNIDGSMDKSFQVDNGVSTMVLTIALQTDGQILLGGGVTKGMVRLKPDGSVDLGFNIGTGFQNWVGKIYCQPDGKILAGGNFAIYNDVAFNNIIRLKGNPYYLNTIQGKIYSESNNDCILQNSETRLSSRLVKALPGPYYGSSDRYGNYIVKVDSGIANYTLSRQYNFIDTKFLLNQCTFSHNVSLKGASKDTCCFNFADSIKQIPLLNISVQNSRMRRCFRGNTYVSYCNYGTLSATNTQVKVIYPSYVVPISSVPMWTSKQDSILIYDIGTLTVNSCRTITITDSVVCGIESIRGLTQCIKATISSSSVVVSEDPSWDKSSMKVTVSCNNGNAVFTIKNAGSGNMIGSHEYRVLVNDTLIFTGNFQLNSGESFTVTYPAGGQTIRLEADQHPLHPGKSRPRATVEDCGTATSGTNVHGLVTTAPQDDLDEETAITCNQIRDSYDPNNKQVIPMGIGANKRISPGEELEYTIRFQNTGTDTAYTVKVVDTLDVNLDAASFTQGTSSHPYTLNVSGKEKAVLTFNFYNINLPDSATNKLACQGLVSFRVTVPQGTPIGTIIENKAHIFFDYNSAIITNETMHTVDNTVYSDLSKGSAAQVGQVVSGIKNKFSELVKIYPNPSSGIITVEIPGQDENSEIKIYSTIGVLQRSVVLSSAKQQINLEGLNQGMYIYEIWQGERKATGMLQVK